MFLHMCLCKYLYVYIYIYIYMCVCESRDSSVGIALGYGPDDRGSSVRFPAGAGNFSLHHRVQNDSGAHPAFYTMGTRGWEQSGRGVKLTTHLHLVPKSRMHGAILPLLQYVFMAWCLVKHRATLPLPSTFIYVCVYVQVHIYVCISLHRPTFVPKLWDASQVVKTQMALSSISCFQLLLSDTKHSYKSPY
jgi:hypothetical protein